MNARQATGRMVTPEEVAHAILHLYESSLFSCQNGDGAALCALDEPRFISPCDDLDVSPSRYLGRRARVVVVKMGENDAAHILSLSPSSWSAASISGTFDRHPVSIRVTPSSPSQR